jgi:peptidoglycan/xylan/chitin deacetylase (PgdA/CDA1 family)
VSPPRFAWPDGCRCACVVSFDVDAETAILQVDPKYATHATTMSHQAYGPRVGVPRLLEQLRRAGIRATFFVPGFTADCYPDTIRRIVADGHEVGWHGYLHELPPRAAGGLVELPVHWSFDDWEQYGFFVDPPLGDSLEAPGKLLEIWQGELEAFREEGCLQVLTMHPFLSGRPARSRTIGRFVSFARELGGVWFATAGEVAEHARSVLGESEARRLRSALDPAYGMREGATSADARAGGP